MRKKENIVRYSADTIRKKIARGESKTDWKRANAIPQSEVERLADIDEGPLPDDWESTVMVGLPSPKQGIHIRLDGDIIEWFKAYGRGYQTRINAALRAFVQTRKRLDARLRPPLDVAGIDTDLSGEEIVDIVRKMRQRTNLPRSGKISRRSNSKRATKAGR